MLFDKRCQDAVKNNAELNREYQDFSRAVNLHGTDGNVEVRFLNEVFYTIPREQYESEMRTHQLALSSNGIYGFAKYHVYTMLHERNLAKQFINFAKTKGYSCVYTN